MPYPSPPRPLAGPRRRSVLVSAVGAALLAACSPGSGGDGGAGDGSSAAAERARERAARDSAALRERYDAAIAAFPALAGRLAPLRSEVDRHARAFGWTAPESGKPAKGAGGAKSTPTPTGSAAPSAPATEKDALAGLAAAERALADRRTEDLLDLPGEPARLLASVAAAGAAHVYLLTENGNAK